MNENKVLLVDDDEQIVKSFERRLRNQFRMLTATRADEGLEALRSRGPVAVVVSDYRMPGMDGVEFLKKVREESPDTVRIMLTGYADLPTAVDAVNVGQVFRFLTKPCPPTILADAIEQGLRFYDFVLREREFIDLSRWRRSMVQIVQAMVRLVESRDPYTAGHQLRVASLSLAIAVELGLDARTQEAIQMAATLHDIGKIYVPSEFLNRPGALSDAEFKIIQAHPVIGHEILSPVEFESPISQMVLQHHERLNGTGYPNGLAGDDILLESTIIAVADVVEAMSSHRPYRPSLGLGPALDEVERRAGQFYNQDAVNACLRLFRDKGFTLEQWQAGL